MRAKVISPFTMGGRDYKAGEPVDFEDWRVQRLVAEKLVTQEESAPEPVVKAKAEAPKPKISRRKK